MDGARGRGWLPGTVAVVALGAGLWAGPQPLDDAFITLRYARSLAEGDGFVFNQGERVLGTTTPLFALLLALLHRLTSVDLVWLAFLLALAAHAAAAALLSDIGRRCREPLAGWLAGALYALCPMALGATLGCMETSAFVLATLAALGGSSRPRSVWRTGAAAAAVLLRPEGVIVAGLHVLQVAGADRPTARRDTRRAAAVILAGTLPWVLFATWYFGTPLPQSVVAKLGYPSWSASWVTTEDFWWVLLSLPFALPMMSFALGTFYPVPFGTLIVQRLSVLGIGVVGRTPVLLSGVAVLAVACVGGVALYRRNRDALWLLLFVVAYCGAFCVKNPQIFPWYLVPPLPVLLLTFVVGGTVTVQTIFSRWRGQQPVAAVLAAALVGIYVWQTVLQTHSFPSARELSYRQAVQALGAAAQDRNILIGALEIGTIGYYSRARILDHYGLVSPEVLQRDIDEVVRQRRPDFYIGHQSLVRLARLDESPFFRDEYQRVMTVSPKDWATYVFVRRDRRDLLGHHRNTSSASPLGSTDIVSAAAPIGVP